tara:strand:+ start:9072 stop:9905 length:834 start_codon:yes stop_codon:yes gene_type:complete
MSLNFYCIGATKSGTSTIHDILYNHPDIYLPVIKETKFFSLNYHKGYDWYLNTYFKKHKKEKAVGEIYPCMSSLEAPKRLYETLGGDIKIFGILRNPADRAYSNYLAQKRILNHNLSFQEALKKLPYLTEKGLYARNILRFSEYFQSKNMRFYIFETEFINNRREMIDDIQDFLTVEKIKLDIDIKSNFAWQPRSKILNRLLFKKPIILDKVLRLFLTSTTLRQKLRLFFTKINSKKISSPKLTNSDRQDVIDKYFYQDILKLEKILGKDLSIWYNL